MQIPPIGRLENYLIPVGLDLGARHHADPNEPVRRQVLLAGEVVELRGRQNAIWSSPHQPVVRLGGRRRASRTDLDLMVDAGLIIQVHLHNGRDWPYRVRVVPAMGIIGRAPRGELAFALADQPMVTLPARVGEFIDFASGYLTVGHAVMEFFDPQRQPWSTDRPWRTATDLFAELNRWWPWLIRHRVVQFDRLAEVY